MNSPSIVDERDALLSIFIEESLSLLESAKYAFSIIKKLKTIKILEDQEKKYVLFVLKKSTI